MNLKINNDGTIELNDARIIYRNFEGRRGPFNEEGKRSFSVIIPDEEIKEALMENGWNVRVKAPRTPDEQPFMHLQVNVKFNGGPRNPNIFLVCNGRATKLNERTIECLDHIDYKSVSMILAPYDWERFGSSGRTAYLRSLEVIQDLDRIAAKYASEEYPTE